MSLINAPSWGLPPSPLPNEIPNELVAVTVDTVQLASVVSSLMKTIHSQSQCIESLDKEARTRKVETEGRLMDLDKRYARELDRLSGEFRDCVSQFREVQSDLRREISSLRHEMTGLMDKTADRLALELDHLTGGFTKVREDVQKLNNIVAEEILSKDRKELPTSEVVSIRERIDTMDANVRKLWDFARQIEEALKASRNEIVGQGEIPTAIRSVCSDVTVLSQAMETNHQAILTNRNDIDNLLLFFSLTRNAVVQCNRNGNQTGVICSTPPFRKLISDCTARSCVLERRLEEILTSLQAHTLYINKKADVDALQQTREILIQSISKGDQLLGLAIEEIKKRLEDVILTLQDRAVKPNSTMQLSRNVRNNDDNRDFENQLAEISRTSDYVRERIDLVDKSVDDLMSRVSSIERELSRDTPSCYRSASTNPSPKLLYPEAPTQTTILREQQLHIHRLTHFTDPVTPRDPASPPTRPRKTGSSNDINNSPTKERHGLTTRQQSTSTPDPIRPVRELDSLRSLNDHTHRRPNVGGGALPSSPYIT
eukprot:NODE_1518_length_1919_cov_62.623051_g1287_i0.p1 GENE.NODE_1518_length_1919_cov_62.623051_g1287_i0~~NODE_1518_length_1919_cov_62.623051_g1287_i0.p1  ORF type:complete len:542 (+),score=108.53 NODE_1518_length_1919_cov_62.623051_g1287_i0:87-1712(+)